MYFSKGKRPIPTIQQKIEEEDEKNDERRESIIEISTV